MSARRHMYPRGVVASQQVCDQANHAQMTSVSTSDSATDGSRNPRGSLGLNEPSSNPHPSSITAVYDVKLTKHCFAFIQSEHTILQSARGIVYLQKITSLGSWLPTGALSLDSTGVLPSSSRPSDEPALPDPARIHPWYTASQTLRTSAIDFHVSARDLFVTGEVRPRLPAAADIASSVQTRMQWTVQKQMHNAATLFDFIKFSAVTNDILHIS